jgi:hypothetical protein
LKLNNFFDRISAFRASVRCGAEIIAAFQAQTFTATFFHNGGGTQADDYAGADEQHNQVYPMSGNCHPMRLEPTTANAKRGTHKHERAGKIPD